MVGNEGIVGISAFLGGETTTSRAVVQSAGHAFLPQGAAASRRLLPCRTGAALVAALYAGTVDADGADSGLQPPSSVDQQLCRWLLLSLDRLPSNELTITQELIANMLGVRREGVTAAAGKLQRAGLIHYSRGKITVLDRPRP